MDREEERAWTQPWDTAGLWMKEQKLESLGDEKGEQVLGRSKLSSRNSAKGKSTFLSYWRALGLPASIKINFNHHHFLGVDCSFWSLGHRFFVLGHQIVLQLYSYTIEIAFNLWINLQFSFNSELLLQHLRL